MNFLKRFQYARDSYLVTVLIVGIALLINFVASRHFLRVDLTQNQIYAISSSSKTLMRDLEDIVTVKVYFSETLPPNLFAVRQYVDDMLDELASYSKGRLVISRFNPETPDVANEAMKLGIPQIQMNIIQKDKLEVKNGFLGIAILFGDKKEVLPVVQTTANLEYDLISAIKKVTAKETKVVAIATGHEEPTLEQDFSQASTGISYTLLKKALDRNYEVRSVTLDEPKALDSVHTLILAGAQKPYTDKEKFAIDQFLMKGGRLIVLADTVDVKSDLQTAPLDLGLNDLLDQYGASVEKSLALDRSNENASFNQGFMTFMIPYPFWVKAVKKFFDPTSPIVAKLDGVSFPWTSPLKLTPKDGIQSISLLQTTPDAWTQSEPFNLIPNQIQAPTERKQTSLAVLLKGNFASFYKGKKSPIGTRDFLQESQKPGQVLVVGNSRFALDRFAQMFPQNLAFLLNAVDDMTMDQSLIGIRSKAILEQPLKELSASERQLVKWIGILLMPILVILFGLFRHMLRKRHHLWY